MDKSRIDEIEAEASLPRLVDVVHSRYVSLGEQTEAWRMDHILSLLVEGSGLYQSGPLRLPEQRRLATAGRRARPLASYRMARVTVLLGTPFCRSISWTADPGSTPEGISTFIW